MRDLEGRGRGGGTRALNRIRHDRRRAEDADHHTLRRGGGLRGRGGERRRRDDGDDGYGPLPMSSAGHDFYRRRSAQGARPDRRRGAAATALARVPSPLAPITTVNEAWTTDFKGHFRTGRRRTAIRCRVRDGFSRLVLRCDAVSWPTDAVTRCASSARCGVWLPERSAVTTAAVCEHGWRACRGSRSGGCGSGFSRSGSPRPPGAERLAEQFHAVLKADTARRRRRTRARNSAASIRRAGGAVSRAALRDGTAG